MSRFNRQYRQAWVVRTYARAVELFHEARKANEETTPLADLARQCANTAFQENADAIIGDREICARAFMAYCREHFGTEVGEALAEATVADIEKRQLEEQGATVN